MSKRNKIIYRISTLRLALGMLSTGIVQIMQVEMEREAMLHLGYPFYFLTIMGVWKILGVIAILVPKYPLVKERAYAGFFFTMSGAIVSHLEVGDPVVNTLPALLQLTLTVVSWYFRPSDRKVHVGRAVVNEK